jgi:hypothetical protein
MQLHIIMAQKYCVNAEIVGLDELKLILHHRSALITLVARFDTTPTEDKVMHETGHVYDLTLTIANIPIIISKIKYCKKCMKCFSLVHAGMLISP